VPEIGRFCSRRSCPSAAKPTWLWLFISDCPCDAFFFGERAK
jgi:hypothetical protein